MLHYLSYSNDNLKNFLVFDKISKLADISRDVQSKHISKMKYDRNSLTHTITSYNRALQEQPRKPEPLLVLFTVTTVHSIKIFTVGPLAVQRAAVFLC